MSKTEESSPSERQKTSSARRLEALCKNLKVSAGPNLFTVLPLVLNLDEEPDLHRRGLAAFSLIEAMLEDLERELSNCRLSTDESTFYLRLLPELTKTFSPLSCTQPWDTTRSQITDGMVRQLHSLHLLFARHFDERELEQDEFGELLESVSAALNSLQDMQMPHRLRDFIASQLLRIKHAIEQYQFRGVVGIEEALAAYSGGLWRGKDEISKAVNADPSPQSRWEPLFKVLVAGDTLMDLATKTQKLWPQITQTAHTVLTLLP